ncbi:Glycosyltransferase RgtA/B/C/D-like domain-containing protein [Flavobacterium branchiophilum]|uniref:Glycosyltransferase RgtA/B/C/D-like domain-containing protein n=2 Tax=Flavobacterium branchiophilum TaxID=55197 RepID=G2Z0P7_FLABF|nr:Probable transmembrane protein of unknown function [Flavobacterium branchiophilum FL-15]
MLIYISYLLLLFSGFQFFKNEKCIDVIIKTSLLFFCILVIITELLSYLNLLNFTVILFFWLLFSGINVIYLIKTKSLLKLPKFLNAQFKLFSNIEKRISFLILLFFSCLLFQGLIYPPNNWDSLTYHMSRIMFWISNESVSHFQTNILRHLYQPPFSEFFILHVCLLQGNDYLANSVQLFFLLLTAVSFYTLLDITNTTRLSKLIGIVFFISTPSILLEATTTKNDIVCGFFIITTALFSIRVYLRSNVENFIFLGLSIGLAIFTKGTAYLFIAPIIVILALFICHNIIKTKEIAIFKNIFFAFIVIFILNFNHFYRNYNIDRNILNIDKVESKMFSNDKMNIQIFTSNLLKNIGLHIIPPFTSYYNDFIESYHQKYELDINSPDTNYYGAKYLSPKSNETHEDLVPNTLQLFFIVLISIYILYKNLYNYKIIQILVLLIILFQLILFVGYLKWQPWHTRLHIPMFIFSAVLVSIYFDNIKKHKKFIVAITLFCCVCCFGFYYLFNNTRPIITNLKFTKNIKINDTRYKKYFSNQLFLYKEYNIISNYLDKGAISTIGFGLNDWEYPLVYNYFWTNYKINCIFVNNSTTIIQEPLSDNEVLITSNKQDFIMYNGKKYNNIFPNHTHLWLYQKN